MTLSALTLLTSTFKEHSGNAEFDGISHVFDFAITVSSAIIKSKHGSQSKTVKQ